MKIVNLTPHTINLYIGENNVITIEPSGKIARVTVEKETIDFIKIPNQNHPSSKCQFYGCYQSCCDIAINGKMPKEAEFSIAVHKNSYGKVENLPNPQNGIIYIVSSIVAQAVPTRKDVFLVDDTVRDENNRIIGCRALSHI